MPVTPPTWPRSSADCFRTTISPPHSGREPVAQARRYSWTRTAERAATLISDLARKRPESAVPALRRPVQRPRIAFFSPFPPRKSGVSDYSALLIDELKTMYTIDLYHESGYVPEPSLVEGGFDCCDARLFPRQAAVRDYHGVVYQMGNSRYHRFLYEIMLRHPGVVTLHDFCLAGFHLEYGFRLGRLREFFRDELLQWYPEQASTIETLLAPSEWNWEELTRECAARGLYLNRSVLDAADRLVVHSPWCVDQLRAAPATAAQADRVSVIPHGIWPRPVSLADRFAIRDRFDIPRDALMVASFGFIHPDKMSPEALDAFAGVARSNPSALFVFAGEEADGGIVRRHATALGLAERVRFLGRQAMPDFTDLIAASDLGVNLRRPPTNGETSGALLYLLAAGVATIVTDVATFSDYPEGTVWKVRWESDGAAGLETAMHTLAGSAEARAALGKAALDHVRAHHDWSRVAERYIEVIEQVHGQRQQPRLRLRPQSTTAVPVPHFRTRNVRA